jgi:hypothetical protein
VDRIGLRDETEQEYRSAHDSPNQSAGASQPARKGKPLECRIISPIAPSQVMIKYMPGGMHLLFQVAVLSIVAFVGYAFRPNSWSNRVVSYVINVSDAEGLLVHWH